MFDENSKTDKDVGIASSGLTEIAMQYRGPNDVSNLYNGRFSRDYVI